MSLDGQISRPMWDCWIPSHHSDLTTGSSHPKICKRFERLRRAVLDCRVNYLLRRRSQSMPLQLPQRHLQLRMTTDGGPLETDPSRQRDSIKRRQSGWMQDTEGCLDTLPGRSHGVASTRVSGPTKYGGDGHGNVFWHSVASGARGEGALSE